MRHDGQAARPGLSLKDVPIHVSPELHAKIARKAELAGNCLDQIGKQASRVVAYA